MSLLDFVTRHVRAVVLGVCGLCALGALIGLHMPVAIFPNLTIPRIIMAAEGGDAPTESVLIGVTLPIEQAVSTIPGLTLAQSQTTRGAAGFTLTFADGTDPNWALQQVQARVAQIRSSLPAGVNVTSEALNPTVFPILDLSLSSPNRSLADLRTLALFTLRPRLARVPGVARVLVNGGDTRELIVTLRPDRLIARGLTQSQVEDALSKANAINAVGSFDNRYVRHQVLVSGLLTDLDSIRRVVVTVKNRVPIAVGDVADVSEGVARRTVIATGGGRQAVLLNIVRQANGNTIDVAEGVQATLREMRATLPPDVTIKPFYNQALIVRESEVSVVEAIAIGGLLALIVVSLFLRNARAAFVALSILPLTLLITFAALRLLGMMLNIMTLGAIAIALGLVIDDAIVVVEHIYRRLEQGADRRDAASDGLREILPAMLASSLATIVAFLPLILLPGITGDFFAPLAKTVVATLIISLTLSVTVAPLLACHLFPRSLRRGSGGTARLSLLARVYGWAARGAIRRRFVTLLVIAPVAIGAWLLTNRLQTGFMPEFDEGSFTLDYKLPAGTSLDETDRVMRQIEQILADTEGVENWSRLTGALSGSGLEICPMNQGDIVVQLKRGRRPSADQIMDDVRTKVLQAAPNLKVELAQALGDLIGDLAGSPSPIEVKIFGPDIKTLVGLAHEVGEKVSSVRGVVDESDGVTESGPETYIDVDPLRAAEHGLGADTVTSAVEGALDGDVVSSVRRGELLEPLRVRMPYRRESTAELLGAMLLPSSSGPPVPLSSVAGIRLDPGTPELDRENQRQMLSVTARLEGIDLGSGVKAVQAKLRDMPLPPGYNIEYGGLYKSQQQSFSALAAVFATAALLLFTVLVVTFRSLRVAVSLFVAAVLSVSGVALALWITGTPLNISSYTGAILIVGIVTENGVLLFDELLRERRARPDEPLNALLVSAGQARVRPILMTTFAAILTLFPLALGIGAGAAMQKPLAIAVVGGLALSTFFTLLLAPTLYAALTSLLPESRR
jgi:CzcA family heavy metal efflux pump